VPLRFVFALHNHQPVGNFNDVFEAAYRDTYWPFLELIQHYPEIPLSLHTSGPLMEWLVERKPEYIEGLRKLVARGQVEIMGGGYYEPILTMIPPQDRIGQIKSYTHYLEGIFPTRIRGMWVPERVWEQGLVSAIGDAGIQYTVLDDQHFKQAGLDEAQLFGCYLTEDDGRLLRIFPGSEHMRYLVPYRDPGETIAYFGEIAGRDPNAVLVFADDGEKFGSWPESHRHCYQDGWLWRFFDALRNARSWVRFCTFSQALDETQPLGRVYLPDCSYREMTEWALPATKQSAFKKLIGELQQDPRWPTMQQFQRGGFWRNFKAKYPETQEMYSRMLEVSRRVNTHDSDPAELTQARRELFRAQCNCPWWHGTFGGLYLPHLRQAVYQHLIAADNAFFERKGPGESWLDSEVADLNLDGKPEVCLHTDQLAAYFSPANGGTLYELDLRPIHHNLLATLSRRPEAYHEAVRRGPQGHGFGQPQFKQTGLDQQLQYDSYLRKTLIDHFYEPGVTDEQVAAGQAKELGDFVQAAYEHQVENQHDGIALKMSRAGCVSETAIRVSKAIRASVGASGLWIRYVLEGLPVRNEKTGLHFAVEFNFAGMAAGADDRYFYDSDHRRLGQLQTHQDLRDATAIGLVDEWLGLDVSLMLSRPGGIWAFPIQTVSQSEGGFELVYQSTAVLPHWLVEPDENGRWEVTVDLKLDVSRSPNRPLTVSA
jgi:alpha-amylase